MRVHKFETKRCTAAPTRRASAGHGHSSGRQQHAAAGERPVDPDHRRHHTSITTASADARRATDSTQSEQVVAIRRNGGRDCRNAHGTAALATRGLLREKTRTFAGQKSHQSAILNRALFPVQRI